MKRISILSKSGIDRDILEIGLSNEFEIINKGLTLEDSINQLVKNSKSLDLILLSVNNLEKYEPIDELFFKIIGQENILNIEKVMIVGDIEKKEHLKFIKGTGFHLISKDNEISNIRNYLFKILNEHKIKDFKLFVQEKRLDTRNFLLSEKDICIIELILKGKSNREIADELFVSEGSAANLISKIIKKLKVKSRAELAISSLKYLNNFTKAFF